MNSASKKGTVWASNTTGTGIIQGQIWKYVSCASWGRLTGQRGVEGTDKGKKNIFSKEIFLLCSNYIMSETRLKI